MNGYDWRESKDCYVVIIDGPGQGMAGHGAFTRVLYVNTLLVAGDVIILLLLLVTRPCFILLHDGLVDFHTETPVDWCFDSQKLFAKHRPKHVSRNF